MSIPIEGVGETCPEFFDMQPETETAAKLCGRIAIRGAVPEDLERLVEIDMRTFRGVYKNYDALEDEIRTDLAEKLRLRHEMLGSKWMRVATIGKEPVGFITGCPTSKSPEDFVPWEDTTDNGTLGTTYDPDGNFLYIVSLSVLREGSERGVQDMLMLNMIGRIIGGNYLAYFESRLPGMKRWMYKKAREEGVKLKQLTEEQKLLFAQQYIGERVDIDGKSVRLDPLLRMYESVGCQVTKLAANAYQDELSMNFGAVCTFGDVIPKVIRSVKPLRKLVGAAASAVSHSEILVGKLI